MAKKTTDSPVRLDVSFTDTKRVKELVALMTDNGITEIELVEDKARILIRRGPVGGVHPVALHPHFPPPPLPAPAPAHATPAAVAPPAVPVVDESLIPIKSPMVGTFYAAPSPDASPYVSVGATVDEKTVVCIIEAMKHFNEIAAETRGTIARILVSNGQVVEFNQPLFLVRPG